MKNVQHEKSAALEVVQHKKVQHDKRLHHEKEQHGNSGSWTNCNIKKLQHKKSAVWKKVQHEKSITCRVKYGKNAQE